MLPKPKENTNFKLEDALETA